MQPVAASLTDEQLATGQQFINKVLAGTVTDSDVTAAQAVFESLLP